MKPITWEEIQEVLTKHSVKWEIVNRDKSGFSRSIRFEVYGTVYTIVWFCNQSKLYIGDYGRSPNYPFKYIFHDITTPTMGGNSSLCFSYDTEVSLGKEREAYASFRIPLPV